MACSKSASGYLNTNPISTPTLVNVRWRRNDVKRRRYDVGTYWGWTLFRRVFNPKQIHFLWSYKIKSLKCTFFTKNMTRTTLLWCKMVLLINLYHTYFIKPAVKYCRFINVSGNWPLFMPTLFTPVHLMQGSKH